MAKGFRLEVTCWQVSSRGLQMAPRSLKLIVFLRSKNRLLVESCDIQIFGITFYNPPTSQLFLLWFNLFF